MGLTDLPSATGSVQWGILSIRPIESHLAYREPSSLLGSGTHSLGSESTGLNVGLLVTPQLPKGFRFSDYAPTHSGEGASVGGPKALALPEPKWHFPPLGWTFFYGRPIRRPVEPSAGNAIGPAGQQIRRLEHICKRTNKQTNSNNDN